MVRREGKKFGFRSGATLRSKFSSRFVGSDRVNWAYCSYDRFSHPKYICTKKLKLKRLRQPQDSKEGVVVKHLTNFYYHKKKDFDRITQKGSLFHTMDQIDGLSYPARNAVEVGFAGEIYGTDDGVLYSLGKHKRWLLPKLIKESLQDDSSEKEDSRVVTIKKRVHAVHNKWMTKNCFEVFDGKTGKVHMPKGRTYDYMHSIYKGNKDVQLRYEFGLPYERSRWPHNQQTKSRSFPRKFYEYDSMYGDYHYLAARNKAYKREWLVKCGDKKEVGKTAGRKRRELLAGHDEFPSTDYRPCEPEQNVNVISHQKFEHARLNAGQVNQSNSTSVELADLLEDSNRARPKLVTEKKVTDNTAVQYNKNRASSALFTMYGKGSAVVVDEPMLRPSIPDKPLDAEQMVTGNINLVQEQPVQSLSTVLNTSEIKQKVELQFSCDSITSSTLREQWNENYQEAKSVPRKFAIDVTPMMDSFSKRQQNVYVLFEPHYDVANEKTHVKTKTSLVVDAKLETIGTDMANLDELFISRLDTGKLYCSLEDVVNCAITCLQEWKNSLDDGDIAVSPTKQAVFLNKPTLPLTMLKDIFSWQFKCYTANDAVVEMKKKLCRVQDTGYDLSFERECTECSENNYCGICFDELFGDRQELDGKCVGFTSLKECGHVFCDSCWHIHLATKISEGNTHLYCPGYKCKAVVDDVTIMAIAPNMYIKFLDRRANTLLDTDPLWQWCPGDMCKQVIKAECSSALPVECSCGVAWCFKCQQEAHWPATCDQARKFLEMTREHEALLGRRDCITSVQVKRCPFCKYPIEKNEGCPHMHCMMCKKDFCWECLRSFDDFDHYDCDNSESMEDVLLSLGVGSERYDKYLKIALSNRLATNRNALRKINKSLTDLRSTVSAFQFLDSFFKLDRSRKPHSTVHNLLDMYVQKGVLEQYKSVTEFKLQAQFVLEGAAKFVGLSMNTKYLRKLDGDIEKLDYVVMKIEEILKDRPRLCRDEVKQQLDKLMHCGRQSIYSIGAAVFQN